ncbi:MAG: hypothetical protein EAZ87_00965 [Nostocales cyanobacterium]|nr:MAG: hypothetical protein EAZ87_00965 [Nostocales cyanobacterium]
MKIHSIKLALSIISSVSLITSLPGKVVAITKPPLEIATPGISIAQTQQVTDVELLAKTINNFFKSNRYLTKSKSLLKGNFDGFNFQFEINTQNILQSDGKFRSEITVMQEESTQSTALVISDGKQVWIYRPDLKQYSVSSYKKFQANDKESFLRGISSLIFLEVPEDTRKTMANEVNEQVLKELGLNDIKQETRTVAGENLSVYIHEDKEREMTIRGFIQPETGNLKQMEISGEFEGVNVVITEQILQRTADPIIDAQTFTFKPPSGVKKVNDLPILRF